jgi:hypothetical protein
MRAGPYKSLIALAVSIVGLVCTTGAAADFPQSGTQAHLIRQNNAGNALVSDDYGARVMFDDGSYNTDSGTDTASFDFVRIATAPFPDDPYEEGGLFQVGWFNMLDDSSGDKSLDDCKEFDEFEDGEYGVFIEWKDVGAYPLEEVYHCQWVDGASLPGWALYGRAVFAIKSLSNGSGICGLSCGWIARLIDTQSASSFCLMSSPYDCSQSGVVLGFDEGYASVGEEHPFGFTPPSYSEIQFAQYPDNVSKLGSFEVLPSGSSTWTTVRNTELRVWDGCDGEDFDWFKNFSYSSTYDSNKGNLRWTDQQICP